MPTRAARRSTVMLPLGDGGTMPLDPTAPPDELIAVCDERGRPLAEGRPRGQVHRDGVWHRSFHCWVVRAAPRGPALVLQRRAPTKQTWPGAWDVSAAGHFRPDEGLAGGLREIAEELGLPVAPDELVSLERHREVLRYPTGLRDREYQDVYLIHREEPLSAYRPDPREVTGLVVLAARGVVALARGSLPGLLGHGWLLGADGWSEQPVRLTRARLVPRAGRYYEHVARAADRLLEGLGTAADAPSTSPPIPGAGAEQGGQGRQIRQLQA